MYAISSALQVSSIEVHRKRFTEIRSDSTKATEEVTKEKNSTNQPHQINRISQSLWSTHFVMDNSSALSQSMDSVNTAAGEEEVSQKVVSILILRPNIIMEQAFSQVNIDVIHTFSELT